MSLAFTPSTSSSLSRRNDASTDTRITNSRLSLFSYPGGQTLIVFIMTDYITPSCFVHAVIACKAHKPCQWKASCGLCTYIWDAFPYVNPEALEFAYVMLINSIDVLLTYTGVLLTSLHSQPSVLDNTPIIRNFSSSKWQPFPHNLYTSRGQ